MATEDSICAVDGCDRLKTSLGLCKSHMRHKRQGKPLAPMRSYTPTPCDFDGCRHNSRTRGLCQTHAKQLRQGKQLTPIGYRYSAKGTCVLDGCQLECRARGLCVNHYAQATRGTINFPELAPIAPTSPKKVRTVIRGCSFEGCMRPHDTHGLCSTHAKQMRSGKELTPTNMTTPAIWSPWRVQSSGYVARWRSVLGVREFELEHRHVMERLLGRNLRPEENVHHLNGDRADNRPSNLELWNTSQPAGQRVEDKIRWAKEILARYENYPAAPAY